MYKYVLLLHILGATIWTGGHLILATRILPRALRFRSSAILLDFEKRFEPLGMGALAVQIVTGLWLASRLAPFSFWFTADHALSRMLLVKFGALALTVAFALDARLRVLPRLRDDNIRSMLVHVVAVTVLGIAFVVAGVGIRTGGWS